jgi:predicted ATPase
MLEAVERAAQAGLVSREEVGRFSFTHELVRAAAEDAMATLDRVETHARAAAVLAGDGSITPAGRLARRAYHALRAAPRSAADARQAVAACRAAATSMIGSFAYERADALLSTAIELHNSLDLGPPVASLLVEWAEAALLCGRLAEASGLGAAWLRRKHGAWVSFRMSSSTRRSDCFSTIRVSK